MVKQERGPGIRSSARGGGGKNKTKQNDRIEAKYTMFTDKDPLGCSYSNVFFHYPVLFLIFTVRNLAVYLEDQLF